MGVHHSVFDLFSLLVYFLIVRLVFAGQQEIHRHEFTQSDYSISSEQKANNPITFQKSSQQNSYQQDQVPVRWRTRSDYKLDNRNDVMDRTESSRNFIETKYEESQRRIIRIRTLTTQQNELRKEVELHETLLNEQIKVNKPELKSIQISVSAIRNSIRKFDRIQIELQKLYSDQIYTEKQLLEHYRTIRPTDLDLHKQLKNGIERWELIYNRLLDMQLNEKQKNEDRELKFDTLLNQFELLQNKQFQKSSSFQPKSPIIYSSSSSSSSSSVSNLRPSTQTTSTSFSSQEPTKLSSSLSSSSYISSSDSTYSSSLKSISSDQNLVNFSNEQTADKTGNLNNVILKRPESQDIKCLSKWLEDLGKEDAEWITQNQLNNEKFFEDLVRLQKAQWDKLYIQHKEKKQQHIPQTFKCDFDKKDLCEQEEANFRKKFNEYHMESYPTKMDHQHFNELNFNKQQQEQPAFGYSTNQKTQQISYSTNN